MHADLLQGPYLRLNLIRSPYSNHNLESRLSCTTCDVMCICFQRYIQSSTFTLKRSFRTISKCVPFGFFPIIHHLGGYVSVKLKLQYLPPGKPRAFDTFAVPGRREFDCQSLPGVGEFDPHALGVGNLNCTLDFM